MKKPVFAAIACLALIPIFPACDSHTWEDSEDGKTKGSKHLFQPHGHKAHGDEEHGDKAHDKKAHDHKAS